MRPPARTGQAPKDMALRLCLAFLVLRHRRPLRRTRRAFPLRRPCRRRLFLQTGARVPLQHWRTTSVLAWPRCRRALGGTQSAAPALHEDQGEKSRGGGGGAVQRLQAELLGNRLGRDPVAPVMAL